MKQRKHMRDIKAEAKQRRASLLEDYRKAQAELPDISLREFGERYDLTGERVGQMLNRALADLKKEIG